MCQCLESGPKRRCRGCVKFFSRCPFALSARACDVVNHHLLGARRSGPAGIAGQHGYSGVHSRICAPHGRLEICVMEVKCGKDEKGVGLASHFLASGGGKTMLTRAGKFPAAHLGYPGKQNCNSFDSGDRSLFGAQFTRRQHTVHSCRFQGCTRADG